MLNISCVVTFPNRVHYQEISSSWTQPRRQADLIYTVKASITTTVLSSRIKVTTEVLLILMSMSESLSSIGKTEEFLKHCH